MVNYPRSDRLLNTWSQEYLMGLPQMVVTQVNLSNHVLILPRNGELELLAVVQLLELVLSRDDLGRAIHCSEYRNLL